MELLECRTCLTKDTLGKMLPIFGDSEALVQKIYDCTGIKLENITGLPSNICECCNSVLILAHRFKMGCLAADIKFKNRYYGYGEPAENEVVLNPVTNVVNTKQESLPENESGTIVIVDIRTLDEIIDLKDIEIEQTDSTSPAMKTRSHPDILSDENSLQVFKKEQMDIKKKKSIRVVEGSKVKYKTECPICGVMQQNLKQHSLVHSKIKLFECTYCSKKFSQRGNYNNHLNLHTGKKPYVCKFESCTKSFADPNSMKSHMISHTQERNYHCDTCGKSFGYSHTLTVHKLSHSQERKHGCHCGKMFMTKYSLTKHSRTHTGEKKFKCKICSKAFSSSGNLSTHHKVHSKLKPFICEICNLSFAYKCVLRNHMKIHQRELFAN